MIECGASLLVTDFTPLREIRKYKEEICKKVGDSVSVHDVDAHNVVPVWEASSKLEYGARTIRSKINKLLPTYLIDYPTLQSPNQRWAFTPPDIHWDKLIQECLKYDFSPYGCGCVSNTSFIIFGFIGFVNQGWGLGGLNS